MSVCCFFTVLLAAGALVSGRIEAAPEGQTVWADVSDGRLKAEVFESKEAGPAPVLMIVLHGDLFGPQATDPYHYAFARQIATGASDVVAAGLLRPGYSDASGDRSDGEPFLGTGDNYTAQVVDAVADTTEYLKAVYGARAVVAVGHSGGAAITALMLARRPEVADAAVLVACPCDLPAWREHMMAERPHPVWQEAIDSLSPLEHVTEIKPSVIVELIVGEQDRVALPDFSDAYASALREQGIDTRSVILPERGHEILLEPAVVERAIEIIGRL